MASLLDPKGIEKYDRLQEAKVARFAKLVRRMIQAEEAIDGARTYKQAVKAKAKYNELKARVLAISETLG